MQVGEVKQAVDALAAAFEQFKQANDEALAQKQDRGQADPLTAAKVDRLQDELDRVKAGLDRARASLNRPAKGRARAGDADALEHKRAMLRYLRRGDEAALARFEQKALTTGSDPEGGFLVTPAMSERIVRTVFETSPVRSLAAVESIGADSLELLVDKDEAGAGWVAESEARAETDAPDLAKIVIPVHEVYAEPRATQRLIDDASVDLEAWLAAKVAEKFARAEATAFLTGNGVGRPRGLLTYPAGTAWGQVEQINSGASGAVTADGLVDLQGSLKDAYGAGAAWLANRLVLRDIRKLKDTTNQYLWQPGLGGEKQETLLGRPILAAADMPTAAPNALAVLYGDLRRAYQIVDRVGIRVLRDPFTAKPYVKFYTTKRVGGDVVNFEAVKILKLA